jgi:glycosyltransferase involved in cell wall biosynthesis
VLPTYKRSHKLKATIDSVFRQSYANWELIVIDDNQPKDLHCHKTESIVAGYSDRSKVVLIKHGVNKGACAARNTGIAAARGEFVAFLDDDDTWTADKLEVQVTALSRDPGAGFAFCDLICVDSTDNTRRRVTFHLGRDDLFRDLLKRGGGICTSALLIRRQVLLEIGGFDASLPSYQDYDLLLRLALRTKHVSVGFPLLDYNVSADGISRNYEAKFRGKRIIIEKYREHFLDKELEAYYRAHLEVLGDYAILHGKRWLAITCYARSLRARPVALTAYGKLMTSLIGGVHLYKLGSRAYQHARQLGGRRA